MSERPNFHDPTAGLGGASPARSALTLRLWLAAFGLAVCAAGAVAGAVLAIPVPVVAVLAALAVLAAVDLMVVLGRKRHGEPG